MPGGVAKTRWHVLWRLARTDVPRTPAQVGEVVGLSAVPVRPVLHRGNADGPSGLADRRSGNGSEAKLTARRGRALDAAVRKRPPDGGLWTGPTVARSVGARWAVSVHPVTAWRWLRGLGLTLQVPRPAHPNAARPSSYDDTQASS